MKFSKPEWHAQLSSTNTVISQRLREGEPLADGFVLAAHEQTAGRGRLGRSWQSKARHNLTFSFLLNRINDLSQMMSLPMAVAIAVAVIMEQYSVEVQTKWPNDLLIKKRKICGILAERFQIDTIVVGVGINVNMCWEDADQIDPPATSLLIETGQRLIVEELLARLLPTMEVWIQRWRKAGFAALRSAWIERCFNLGEYIQVGDRDNPKMGILVGFGDEGQLLLREDDGQQVEIWTGDLITQANTNDLIEN